MEVLNMTHSDSMSPTSRGMCEKFFRRWELKTSRTGASTRRSQFSLTTRLGLPDRDLQLSLDRFAAECKAAGMRISTSKSESMVLNWTRMECTLRGGQIGVASAVMRTLHRSVVVKRELSRKAKLSIYRSIFVPSPMLWVVTERIRSRVQADKMSFLRRVAGLSLRDRVRSSVIRE
ncbi:hypothetical protein N1851_031223 [Merluccius polli]|uniref:Uncharacterized protein n=1 Tax=Merluccius polli TaxID=89951 RepID=A0AA47M400_MERPO|nr:hypothetical protein N1851_031223 [Merluccius polli]